MALAGGEDEGAYPDGSMRTGGKDLFAGEDGDGLEVTARQQGAEPFLGGVLAARGMLVEQALVDAVGEDGLAGLEGLGEGEAGGVVGGVALVGVGKVEEGLGGVVGGEGLPGLLHEEPAAGLAEPVPRGRPGDVEDVHRVADDAEENEDGEDGGEVEGGDGAAVVAEGAAPERADVGGVGGAAPALGGFDEERADAAEAGGGGPLEAGLAMGFEGAAGIAGTLARAEGATAAQPEPGFPGVPVEEAPCEAEEVGEPASHPPTLGARELRRKI